MGLGEVFWANGLNWAWLVQVFYQRSHFICCLCQATSGRSLGGNLINACVPQPLNESIKVMWLHPVRRGGGEKKESLLIPLIEISLPPIRREAACFWTAAKAELIGHQSLLCVKSHLLASWFVGAPPLFAPGLPFRPPSPPSPKHPPQNFTH